MSFLKVETIVRRVVITPQCDNLVHRIPKMNAAYINNATIETHTDGSIIITWLEPLNNWRKSVDDLLIAFGYWSGILLISGLFWFVFTLYAGYILEYLGLI